MPSFIEAWNQATQVQRALLIQVISNSSIEEVRAWFQSVHDRKIVDLKYYELRDLARRRRIPNYSRMLKYELITALLEKKDVESGES